jgi:hypothetical protein
LADDDWSGADDQNFVNVSTFRHPWDFRTRSNLTLCASNQLFSVGYDRSCWPGSEPEPFVVDGQFTLHRSGCLLPESLTLGDRTGNLRIC